MCARPPAAQQHRRVRALNRLGPLVDGVEVDELAVELRLVVGPDRLHRQDALAQQCPTGRGVSAMVAHLLGQPAGTDPQLHPAAGQQIQGGDLLGQVDRVPLHHEGHRGAQPQPARDPRHGGERDDGVQRTEDEIGVGRLAVHRDVAVLAHEARLEAAFLQRRGGAAGRIPSSVRTVNAPSRIGFAVPVCSITRASSWASHNPANGSSRSSGPCSTRPTCRRGTGPTLPDAAAVGRGNGQRPASRSAARASRSSSEACARSRK